MKSLFKLAMLVVVVVLGGVALVRFIYDCSWRESFDIADEFVDDLLGS